MPSWDNTPSGTMRAIVLSSPGSSPKEAFTIDNNYPKPTLPSDEWVLVRVRASGINRCDLRARIKEYFDPLEFGIFADEYRTDTPDIIGEEFVGEVADAGAKTRFKKGERVAGFVYGGGKAYNGSYAEYVLCHGRRCWKLGKAADDLPWEVLGAVPLSMWTAYGAIFVAAETEPGDTVFVHGASSSVGIWAVIVAKLRGCTVIASTRQQSKVQRIKDAGADHVVLESELEKGKGVRKYAPKGVDTVIELVGLTTVPDIAFPTLALHGTVVNLGVLNLEWGLKDFRANMIPLTGKLTIYTTMEEDMEESQEVLLEIVEKIKEGKIKKEQFLDRVFDMEEVAEAHSYMEENRAVGKLVLRIK